MNDIRVNELFSNEEYVKGLFELGSYEAASAKLAEDGVEVSADELRKCLDLARKKESGELSDEELEQAAGGFDLLMGVLAAGVVSLLGGIYIHEKVC